MHVRRALRELHVGYRLHVKGLKGSPDVVMKGRKAVVFVHGCFWHRHVGCKRAFVPKTRADWWTSKFAKTVERDHQAEASLKEAGWRVGIIWECETKDFDSLKKSLADFLFGNEGEA